MKNLNLYHKAVEKGLFCYLISIPFKENEFLPPCYITNRGTSTQKILLTDKSLADAVQALIGCFLISAGQKAALKFMSWIGLEPIPHGYRNNLVKLANLSS